MCRAGVGGGGPSSRADVSFPSAEHGNGASAHQKLWQLLRGGLLRPALGRAAWGSTGDQGWALPLRGAGVQREVALAIVAWGHRSSSSGDWCPADTQDWERLQL